MKTRLLLLVLALVLLIPSPGVVAVDHYTIRLYNVATGDHWWDAPYIRTLSSTVGWTDGDRAGYKCAYGFLLRSGQVVGRFTFTRIPEAAAYAGVNDKYMVEGSRHYATGKVGTRRNPVLQSECPAPTESYASFNGSQLPTIRFMDGSTVLETRSYPSLEVHPDVTFRQISKTDRRIVLVAYLKGVPAIAIYYDAFSTITLTSDIG
jgi:hypothetical protein